MSKEKPQVGDVWEDKLYGYSHEVIARNTTQIVTLKNSSFYEVIDINIFLESFKLIERNGKPVNEPETLKERISAKWPDKVVVMLSWKGDTQIIPNWVGQPNHIEAQSVRNFAGYVYINQAPRSEFYSEFRLDLNPVAFGDVDNHEIVHPVGCLFKKDS